MKSTIALLKKKKAKIWARVAELLSLPKRRRISVNLSKLEQYAKEGEVIIVPGKILNAGVLKKKITVSAFAFSKSARDAIQNAGARIIEIGKLVEENPNGRGVRILR